MSYSFCLSEQIKLWYKLIANSDFHGCSVYIQISKLFKQTILIRFSSLTQFKSGFFLERFPLVDDIYLAVIYYRQYDTKFYKNYAQMSLGIQNISENNVIKCIESMLWYYITTLPFVTYCQCNPGSNYNKDIVMIV